MRHLEADQRHFHRQVKDRLTALDDDVKNLIELCRGVLGGGPDEKKAARVMLDQFWFCERCKAKLAFFDHVNDEMRIRFRDLFIYLRPGDGGELTYICRGCGYVNKLIGTKKEEEPEEAEK
jgi:hypothetical protein